MDNLNIELPPITITSVIVYGEAEGTVRAECFAFSETISETDSYIGQLGTKPAEKRVVEALKKKIASRLFDSSVADMWAKGPDAPSATPDIIGKPVRLKSGGHTMTAASLDDDGGILCFWFAGEVMQQSIPLAALEVVVQFQELTSVEHLAEQAVELGIETQFKMLQDAGMPNSAARLVQLNTEAAELMREAKESGE